VESDFVLVGMDMGTDDERDELTDPPELADPRAFLSSVTRPLYIFAAALVASRDGRLL
jgi:hypothetical protein